MAEFIHVKGFAELETFLRQLPAKVERNVLRGALRAAAKIIQARAKANVRKRSRATEKSIKVGSRSQGGQVTAYVRVKDFKANWLEYGTRPHQIKPKNGKALAIAGKVVEHVNHPGARPYPFLRPALDQGAPLALIAAAEYMKQRLATKEGLDTSDVQIGIEE